ncbi:MAG TPA: excinuclease ABC subunit UvrC, partial [Methylomirabilota bacterium]|nr:excinuclease ABC subunit UvrC [Methylomirabilota bacterium]
RPCLQYYIHRCHAPCTGQETREGYARTVADVQAFLDGREDHLARRLTVEMEEAAAAEKFERAAVLRDRVQALNRVRERQKIISTEPEDQDVLGLARQGSEACVQVFFVRRGRLLGRESFFLDRLLGAEAGDILSAFLRQFYAKEIQPPREILLSTEAHDAPLIAEWLEQRRGARVDLVVPQRGRKRELTTMAEENAALALGSHLLARSSRRQVVAEDLRRTLGLATSPHRIEGFDISNLQGTEAVGSMVVWEAGDMKKDDYKRFRIRTVPGADDYGMMAEVLRRRYGKALEDGTSLPDLVLLDGGRGQLNVGVRVLEELGLDYLPVVALAKREEEVYHPASLHPLSLDAASPALHALQRIRDEAHRFAVTYHKTLRTKRTLTSVLDQIPGIGPTLRTNLLRHLGSARRIRTASVAELAAVPRITPKLAQRIHEFFHPRQEGAGSPPGSDPAT